LIQIDSQKLISLISSSTFGTGTLSTAARIHPDELQKLIAVAEGEEPLVSKLEGILGAPFRIPVIEENIKDIPEDRSSAPLLTLPPAPLLDKPINTFVSSSTVDQIILAVKQDKYPPADVLTIEEMSDTPRVTLTRFLKNAIQKLEDKEEKE